MKNLHIFCVFKTVNLKVWAALKRPWIYFRSWLFTVANLLQVSTSLAPAARARRDGEAGGFCRKWRTAAWRKLRVKDRRTALLQVRLRRDERERTHKCPPPFSPIKKADEKHVLSLLSLYPLFASLMWCEMFSHERRLQQAETSSCLSGFTLALPHWFFWESCRFDSHFLHQALPHHLPHCFPPCFPHVFPPWWPHFRKKTLFP